MKTIKILTVFLVAIILSGCENRKCIKSHKKQDKCFYYIYQKIGNVTVMTPVYYDCTKTICDEYE